MTCDLSQPTLVLNKSWVAIDTTPLMDALRLLFKGAAVAISPDTYEVHGFESWAALMAAEDEPHVKTVRLRIPVPEVIALTGFNGVPVQSVNFTRRNLFKRDKNTCQYCGVQPGTSELTIDHVTPRSRGGKSSWENCVLACVGCNRRKADRTLRQSGMQLRCTLQKPTWKPTLGIPVGRLRQSWAKFVSEQYWDTLLED
jgi:5-methylcytosine-specific restriction endonuclease McrA